MKCFNKDYSKIYDSLYKKKNYKKEFNLIKKIIKKNFLTPSSLLDLGCGTGEYSYLMTKLGLKVVGVDRSHQMLKIAKKKYYKNPKLKFLKSDIEKLNLKKKFDIISALFHILSYHTTKSKIESFFLKSHKHLKKNGILIFDFWNKDGVYNLQSPLRIREVETNYLKILRVTISKLPIGVKALGTYPISNTKDTVWQKNIGIEFAGTYFWSDQYIYCDEDGMITSRSKLI